MASQKLLLVIALAVALLGCVARVAKASRAHLDCSSTYGGASLVRIHALCEKTSEKDEPLQTLQTIETCACALINHELVWASLMTHENEILFMSIKQLVDQWDEKLTQKEKEDPHRPTRENNALFKGEDGDRRYYWDRLDDILRNSEGENDDDYIFMAIRENFSKIYYDPATFKLKYNDTRLVQSQKLRVLVSDACKSVLGKFASSFLMYFDRMSRISENDRLFFALTAYNEDLYKIRINSKTCLYLLEKGQIVL